MMISPKTYYEMYLKDKDENQILEKIHELKKEIKELKHIMEHPDYQPTNKPDEATQLWCNRLYLEQAKQTLEAIGGVYKPTNEEILAQNFNKNITFIEKIEFESNSYLGGLNNITVTFEKTNAIIKKENFKNPNLSTTIHIDKEDFLDELRTLDIGEWEKSYYADKYGIIIIDGVNWDLTIYFSNGHKTKRVTGTNAFPYNFDKFMELLEFEDNLIGE